MKKSNFTVVIVTNGPGELTTWVKPIVEKLRENLIKNKDYLFKSISISLVLVPCPNSTGTEKFVAEKWGYFTKVTSAKNFWKLLINPNKYGIWTKKGIVIFLGGDQFWTVLLSARLNYKHLTYGEWVVRWPQWNDHIFAMSEKVKSLLPAKFKNKCTVVGDIMADINEDHKKNFPIPEGEWIALLPGSKKTKLSIGVPFFLEVVDHLKELLPKCNLIIPIAPTINKYDLKIFANKANPIAQKYNSGIKEIKERNGSQNLSKIITEKGNEIYLLEEYPSYSFISQCDIALTTVGANTAELAALGVPMIVVVPTQHLGLMESWDGFLGILGRLPILKKFIGYLISYWRMRKNRYLAWPNISANTMIVPERVGNIFPKEIAEETFFWIKNKDKLEEQKSLLRQLRGKPGAVNKIVEKIEVIIKKQMI